MQQLNPSEISELIKSKIQNLALSADVRTQGTVVSVTDGICRIHGLSDVMAGEMLEFPKNPFGLALNLERDSVGAVVLGPYEHISEGDTVKCTGRILDVPVGPELIGRVVNSLGQPIDGKGPVNAKMTDVIEKVAPGVIERISVSQPVQTGLKSIDSMVPIGRGQRELIIGDRQTGGVRRAIVDERAAGRVHEHRAVEMSGPELDDLADAAGHGIAMTLGARLRVVHRSEALRDVVALFEGRAILVEGWLIDESVRARVEAGGRFGRTGRRPADGVQTRDPHDGERRAR